MTDKPESVMGDDLKQISGIGPAIERRLQETGVLTFAQLAAMTPAALAERLQDFAGMSASRIEQYEWAAQARELASEAAESEPQAQASGNGQHYATFNIELLLDEANEVRRTRAVHIQGREDQSWAGWDRERLIGFLEEQANLQREAQEASVDEQEPPEQAAPEATKDAPERARRSLQPAPAMQSSLDVAQQHALQHGLVDLEHMKMLRAERASRQADIPGRGHVEVQEGTRSGRIQIAVGEDAGPRRVLRHGDPFHVQLTLESEPGETTGAPAEFTARLFAQAPGATDAQPVGEAHGMLAPGERNIEIDGHIATPGLYRLEAALTFAGALQATRKVHGDLVHVY